ncbi:MAG: hypothetical protein AB7T06_13165 [Kofleriaceae bacterium]
MRVALLVVLAACAAEPMPSELACVERAVAIRQGIFGYALFEYEPACNCQRTRANARITAMRVGLGVETAVTTELDGFYELELEPGEYGLCIDRGTCEDITVEGGLAWWDYSPGLGIPAWRPVGCAFPD